MMCDEHHSCCSKYFCLHNGNMYVMLTSVLCHYGSCVVSTIRVMMGCSKYLCLHNGNMYVMLTSVLCHYGSCVVSTIGNMCDEQLQ